MIETPATSKPQTVTQLLLCDEDAERASAVHLRKPDFVSSSQLRMGLCRVVAVKMDGDFQTNASRVWKSGTSQPGQLSRETHIMETHTFDGTRIAFSRSELPND